MLRNLVTLLMCIAHVASLQAVEPLTNTTSHTAPATGANMIADKFLYNIGEGLKNDPPFNSDNNTNCTYNLVNLDLIPNPRDNEETNISIHNALSYLFFTNPSDLCPDDDDYVKVHTDTIQSLANGINDLYTSYKKEFSINSTLCRLNSTLIEEKNELNRKLRRTHLLSGLGIGAALIGGYCIGNLFPYFNPWSRKA